jgi:hypothetical protein
MKSCSVTGALLAIALLACGIASATTPPDPCQSLNVVKDSVAVSINATGLGNIQLIPASTQSIHVCGFVIDGANYGFVYGSGTKCSTRPVRLTGTLAGQGVHSYSGPGTIFSIPANNALCVNITSVGPFGTPLQGVLTYTQP